MTCIFAMIKRDYGRKEQRATGNPLIAMLHSSTLPQCPACWRWRLTTWRAILCPSDKEIDLNLKRIPTHLGFIGTVWNKGISSFLDRLEWRPAGSVFQPNHSVTLNNIVTDWKLKSWILYRCNFAYWSLSVEEECWKNFKMKQILC